jgi:hypothetical protein
MYANETFKSKSLSRESLPETRNRPLFLASSLPDRPICTSGCQSPILNGSQGALRGPVRPYSTARIHGTRNRVWSRTTRPMNSSQLWCLEHSPRRFANRRQEVFDRPPSCLDVNSRCNMQGTRVNYRHIHNVRLLHKQLDLCASEYHCHCATGRKLSNLANHPVTRLGDDRCVRELVTDDSVPGSESIQFMRTSSPAVSARVLVGNAIN